jgi:hypothetical protein
VIAWLRESSPYFVLDECRIKRDECAFVGSKTSYFAVWQLTGFITFQGKEYVRIKQQTRNERNGLKGVNIFKNDHRLRGNAKSQKF